MLRLTGAVVATLTGGPITLAEPYAPVSPDISPTEFTPEALRDGGEVLEITRRDVEESIRITITGADDAAVRQQINYIESAFTYGEQYQRTKRGTPTYLEFDPMGVSNLWRSQILYGRVEPLGNAARAANWSDAAIQALVTWKRRFYWEGEQTEISLSNNGGSGTGGRTIYNYNDYVVQENNWVDASGITGVIPSPLFIYVANTYNVSPNSWKIWVGVNAFSGYWSQIVEGEDATYTVGGSTQSDANSSGGEYQQATWATDSETEFMRWTLSTVQLGDLAGAYYRLLARFATAIPSGLKVTPRIRYPAASPTTTVAEGKEITLGSERIQDLGVLQIPPWLIGTSDLAPLALSLYGRRTGGATVGLDFLQLTPLDGFRMFTPRGVGLDYQDTLYDDGIEGMTYAGAPGSRHGLYVPYGQPLYVWPGRTNRLHFLATNENGDAEIARTHSITAYYRPRRLTV